MLNISTPTTKLSLHQSVTSDFDDSFSCGLDDDNEITISSQIDDNTSDFSPLSEASDDDDEAYNESDYDSDDDIPILSLFGMITESEESCVFAENGYTKLDKICDTLQGELYKAEVNDSEGTYVAIKKIEIDLAEEQITKSDDGVTFCVANDILNERDILQYLTKSNNQIANNLVKYIDFFQSDDAYYLVMEYVEGMNLKQFIQIAHQYIIDNKLKLRAYQKLIKYIMFQLVTTIRSLHDIYQCCHLDLCLENVMLENVKFVEQKDGTMSIPTNISIKLCDFGVAELFKDADNFKCNKQGLTIHHQYTAPNVDFGSYDARAADMWSLGMIFYACLTGQPLFEAEDLWQKNAKNGYWAIRHNELNKYLEEINFTKYFNRKSYGLLLNLLTTKEKRRISSCNCMGHEYFQTYFKKYSTKMSKK